MRDLPRKLTVEELADLFQARSRFVEMLAGEDDPLGRALFGCRAAAQVRRADARMVRERLDLLVLREPAEHLPGAAERIVLPGQRLDEAATGLEEVGELFHGQLPR